jgi:hypothetical protein
MKRLFEDVTTTPAIEAAFERLWAAYPQRRPNPRDMARATFRALARRVDPERLVQAAEAFAAEVRALGIKPEFIPHTRTWLHQRRWQDYPPFKPDPASAAPAAEEPAIDHPWWPACAGSVAPHEFRSFLARLWVVDHAEGESALLGAPSRFVADTCRARYLPLLCRALRVGRIEITTEADQR